MTLVVVILVSIVLIAFMLDYVKLKVLVTEFAISNIPQVEAVVQTKPECDLHWYVYLSTGLILGIALWLILEKIKAPKPWQETCLQTQYIFMCFC